MGCCQASSLDQRGNVCVFLHSSNLTLTKSRVSGEKRGDEIRSLYRVIEEHRSIYAVAIRHTDVVHILANLPTATFCCWRVQQQNPQVHHWGALAVHSPSQPVFELQDLGSRRSEVQKRRLQALLTIHPLLLLRPHFAHRRRRNLEDSVSRSAKWGTTKKDWWLVGWQARRRWWSDWSSTCIVA